jgi:hypothetical protein
MEPRVVESGGDDDFLPGGDTTGYERRRDIGRPLDHCERDRAKLIVPTARRDPSDLSAVQSHG